MPKPPKPEETNLQMVHPADRPISPKSSILVFEKTQCPNCGETSSSKMKLVNEYDTGDQMPDELRLLCSSCSDEFRSEWDVRDPSYY